MGKKTRSGGSRFNAVTSCISTALVLIMLGMVVFFVTVAENFSRSLRENFTVEVLLADSLSNKELRGMQTELRALPFVRHVAFISKEKGLKDMVAAIGNAPDEFLGYNPIPAEFELYLKADYASPDSLKKFLPALKKKPGVTDVLYPEEEMESVAQTIPRVSIVLLSVALLLAFISFSLINNTMRMSIYARRFSIHTMKLVGANPSFIRRPFLAGAFWIGLAAVVLSGGILGAGMYYLCGLDTVVAALVTPFVVAATLGSVAVCGIVLTLACAFVSVNRFLRMKTSEIYLR